MIIQALTKQVPKAKKAEEMNLPPAKDTIIIKFTEVEEVKENGERVIKLQETRVNVTKKVNETAKLILQQSAVEKLAELEKIFSK